MSDIHGTLLIGGTRLDDLSGACEQDPSTGRWRGKLIVDQLQGSQLNTERTYRLELDDGRATQVVIHRISPISGEALLRVEFESLPPSCRDSASRGIGRREAEEYRPKEQSHRHPRRTAR